MELIEKALKVASQAHEGQYRKTTKIPYITHPVAVGMILMKAGYDEELIASGILHDTVEDTTLTIAEITHWFGTKIGSIVKGCTESDKTLPWESRKKESIEFLKTASLDIKVVACADKLHNIRSIRHDFNQIGEEIWERFNRGRELQEWYYRSVADSLGYQSQFTLLNELHREIDLLFGGTDL